MTTTLRTEKLEVAFGNFVALGEVDFSCVAGEVHAIIGPNGAGKTTFVNAVTGLVPTRSGVVRLAGRDITGRKPVAIARTGLARTFQHPEVFDSLTPAQHLLAVRPGPGAAAGPLALAEELVASLPNDLADRLSFFHRRVLELSRALAMGPQVLFLDEPVSGLDEGEREEMSKMVARSADEGVSIVLIEHDMRVVRRLAASVTVFDNGEVVTSGPATDVLSNAEVIRAYMGEQ